MATHDVPEDVQRFIFDHIDSVEQLDVLLLLREHPDRQWSSAQISTELRTSPLSVDLRLRLLKAQGLIDDGGGAPPSYRFQPQTPALAARVSALADIYRVRRHAVYGLIFSPLKRVRTFANAFMVCDDGKDDEKNG